MSKMTQAEWIAKAKARYMECTDMDNVAAEAFAGSLYEDNKDDDPVAVVDEDLRHWADDEEQP